MAQNPQKKQILPKNILGLLILLIVGLFGYGGYSLFMQFSQQNAQVDTEQEQKIKIRKASWDTSLFRRFQSLKNYSSGPLEPGTPGNSTPFSRPE